MNDKLPINQITLEETIPHTTPEFPYVANLCRLHEYPDYSYPWHWHHEIEIFYIREGQLDYILPSGIYTFHQGEGGFLNSNILHMTRCHGTCPCIQEEHIFLPDFIGGHSDSILSQRYLAPVLNHPSFELFRLDPSIPPHQEIIQLLQRAYAAYVSRSLFYEFHVRQYMTSVWQKLFLFLPRDQPASSGVADSLRIKEMMRFISQHYHEKLTLQQIADAGYVSLRECSRCFQKNLGVSPISYLLDFRLRKACDLLLTSHISVTEIALACGFSNGSYFTSMFRQKFGVTPRSYRISHSQEQKK